MTMATMPQRAWRRFRRAAERPGTDMWFDGAHVWCILMHADQSWDLWHRDEGFIDHGSDGEGGALVALRKHGAAKATIH